MTMRPGSTPARALARTLLLGAAALGWMGVGACGLGAQEVGGPLRLQGAVDPPRPALSRQAPARARPPRPSVAERKPTPPARARAARPAAPKQASTPDAAPARPAVRPRAAQPTVQRAARPPRLRTAAPAEAPTARPTRPPVRQAPVTQSRDEWAKAAATARAEPPVSPRTPLPPARPLAEAQDSAPETRPPVVEAPQRRVDLVWAFEGADDPHRPVLDAIAQASGQPIRWEEKAAVPLSGGTEADLALVSTVVLRRDEGRAQQGRIATIAKVGIGRAFLFADPARRGLSDLDGQRVAVVGRAAEAVAAAVFAEAGLRPELVVLSRGEGAAQLGDGRAAALFELGESPVSSCADLPPTVRLLPLAFTAALRQAGAYPAKVEAGECPGRAGEGVETVAVGQVLVALRRPGDREQEQRLTAFVEGLFPGLERLAAEDPRWRELNLAAGAPPWPRLDAVRRWLQARGVSGMDGPHARTSADLRPERR